MNRNIVCFGCGDFGKYFIDTYGKYVKIDFFLDNHSGAGDQFYGYERFLPSKEKCKGKYVIVTNVRYYQEIAIQLGTYGLKEDSDFTSIREFEKKYAMIRDDLRAIRCWFVDFWRGFDPYDNPIIKVLRKYYNVILDSENPEFLFSSVFYSEKGMAALKYPCVRIFYTGENFVPVFYIYDYAIGFDYIDYGDRYLRWPLYKFYCEDFELAIKKHILYDMDRFMERDFCCRVVSSNISEFREHTFMEMNNRRYVASGGKCKNNLPSGKNVEDKAEFLSKYKFNLAMENADSPGYITEKIIQAWAAGCIPIYWGGRGKAEEEFNRNAYIDCNDFSTITELLEYLMILEHDRAALEKILAAPIFLNDENVKQTALEKFLKDIIDKNGEKIRRLSAVSVYARNQEQMYLQYFRQGI